jgi:hypothetical protein
MSEHLSEQILDSYRKRTISPADLISTDDHLAGCEVCHRRVMGPASEEEGWVSLPVELSPNDDVEIDHLSYEQLAAYADHKLGDVEREIADIHLEVCAECAGDLHDLEVFRDAMISGKEEQVVPPRFRDRLTNDRGGGWRWFPSRLAWAAAVAVVAALAIVIWVALRSQHTPRTEVAKSERAADVSGSPQPNTNVEATPTVEPPPNPASDVAVVLNDAGGSVTLDKLGHLEGLDELSPSQLRAVKAALLTGSLNAPPGLAELQGKPAILMGGSGAGVPFALLTPVGKVVLTEFPTFRWQQLSGASAYSVNIYDAKFNKVATSPPLRAPQWTTSQPLQRGELYRWQVTAVKDGKETKSPVSPAPEARFQVLAQTQADEIARTKRAHPNSHLLLGTLCAEAGLLDEAEREFQLLSAANPTSSIASKLLRNVRALKYSSRARQ